MSLRFQDIPKFQHGGNYCIDVCAAELPAWMARVQEDEPVELDPDFQRGHVWSKEQQTRYLEYLVRGGHSSRDIWWNHPAWLGFDQAKGSDLPLALMIVDGKQRLTAVLEFLADRVPVFGHPLSAYSDPHAVTKRHQGVAFKVHINNIQTRRELLQWYLDLNSGGVVHTSGELARVRALLAAAP